MHKILSEHYLTYNDVVYLLGVHAYVILEKMMRKGVVVEYQDEFLGSARTCYRLATAREIVNGRP